MLGTVLIVITQTTAFRSWLRGYIAHVAAENLNGRWTLDDSRKSYYRIPD